MPGSSFWVADEKENTRAHEEIEKNEARNCMLAGEEEEEADSAAPNVRWKKQEKCANPKAHQENSRS